MDIGNYGHKISMSHCKVPNARISIKLNLFISWRDIFDWISILRFWPTISNYAGTSVSVPTLEMYHYLNNHFHFTKLFF